MRGLMMDVPLLISDLIRYAATYHRDTEIVTRTVEGPIERQNWATTHDRSQKLARALARLGVTTGDRVATVAWNTHRHLELYYAVSGMGAVCHTINPRLFANQLIYILNHAEDRVAFVDLTFVPLLEAVREHIGVKTYVVMTDRQHMPETSLPGALCYEDLLDAEDASFDWPSFDENTASSLCYTSGTTGHPKGVLYSHRSTVLHAWAACLVDTLALSARECALPVVPMFHANAWGLPYSAALVGSKVVMPGARLDGEGVFELLRDERVTMTAGVPTVWLMLLEHMRKIGESLPDLKSVVIGGSAAPRAMIDEFQREHGVQVLHAWGMTETSPLGTVGSFKARHLDLDSEARLDLQVKQGRGVFGVDLRIRNEDEGDEKGGEAPRDGSTFGELQVKGPWVASEYYRHEGGDILDQEGWFSTGDVATLDRDGFLQITDRSKDVIKSGGEWISSIDLENAAVAHPSVAEAAVIGIAHPKWDERPLLIIRPVAGETPPTHAEMLAFLEGKVAKWWLPDALEVVDELPHTATGKISKLTLRKQFADYQLPSVS